MTLETKQFLAIWIMLIKCSRKPNIWSCRTGLTFHNLLLRLIFQPEL